MAYIILENNGIDITNIDGAVFNNFASGNRSGIMGGYLNECALSATGNSIILSTGCLLLHGIRVKITEVESVVMSSTPSQDTRYQLIAQVIVDTAGKVNFSLFVQTVQALTQDSLYVDGMGIYQLEIGRFTHTVSGAIQDIVRTADTIYGGSSITADVDVGTVITDTLPAGVNAEVDIDKRLDGNKTLLDFKFSIPTPAGTTVLIDGEPEESISFVSDPQTQLNEIKDFIAPKQPKVVEDVISGSRITATNDVEIIDSQPNVKTAEILSVKGVSRVVDGVIKHTNLRKLISTGNNLVNIADYNEIVSNQRYRNVDCGIVLQPNTAYRLSYDYQVVSTTAPILRGQIILGMNSTPYIARDVSYPNMVGGKVELPFVSGAVPEKLWCRFVCYETTLHTSNVRISNVMLQYADNPNTAYKAYTEDYINFPAITLRSNAETADELTPTQHIQNVDETTLETLAEPIYTPIVWDNKYSAWNYGMEKTDDLALFTIKYPLDVVKQVETNTEILAEQEKQIADNKAVLDGRSSTPTANAIVTYDSSGNAYVKNQTTVLNSLAMGNAPVVSADAESSIAIGASASASGGSSTALGNSASAEGTASTALGNSASAEGILSTALGSDASASGSSSTALGRYASASGGSSTALGNSASASGDSSTALGYLASVSASEEHTIRLGYSALSALKCAVALSVTSDERDKTDINNIPNEKSLDFIKQLNPIQYVRNARAEYELEKNSEKKRKYGLGDYDKEAHARGDKKGERKRVGFSAQQIEQLIQSVFGTDNYADIVYDNFYDMAEKPTDAESQKTVAYEKLIPFLVGAIQEQQKQIDELKQKINT